ncbi:unnamed protein product [Urochloa humidicola]
MASSSSSPDTAAFPRDHGVAADAGFLGLQWEEVDGDGDALRGSGDDRLPCDILLPPVAPRVWAMELRWGCRLASPAPDCLSYVSPWSMDKTPSTTCCYGDTKIAGLEITDKCSTLNPQSSLFTPMVASVQVVVDWFKHQLAARCMPRCTILSCSD